MKTILREIAIILFIALAAYWIAAPTPTVAGEDCSSDGYCNAICYKPPRLFCIYMDRGSGTQECYRTNHNL